MKVSAGTIMISGGLDAKVALMKDSRMKTKGTSSPIFFDIPLKARYIPCL